MESKEDNSNNKDKLSHLRIKPKPKNKVITKSVGFKSLQDSSASKVKVQFARKKKAIDRNIFKLSEENVDLSPTKSKSKEKKPASTLVEKTKSSPAPEDLEKKISDKPEPTKKELEPSTGNTKIKIKVKRRPRLTPQPDFSTKIKISNNELQNLVRDISRKQKEDLASQTSSYYMNNRAIFIQFINSLFSQYKERLIEESKQTNCEDISLDKPFSLLVHQRIVRDYLNLYTPYRGLLLYHGLGSGKTCSSITIAEGLKSSLPIIVMTKASLRPNYISELKKCGDLLFRLNQHWTFADIQNDVSQAKTLADLTQLPIEYIVQNKGIWLSDSTKNPNYSDLKTNEQKNIDDQVSMLINIKYSFINYNGLNWNTMRSLSKKGTINPFDNKVIIIDESQNLIARITNQLNKNKKKDSKSEADFDLSDYATGKFKKGLAILLYAYLVQAKNCRIVLLSGTPIINKPNEIGVLYNILRGFIKTWTFQLDISNARKLEEKDMKKLLTEAENLGNIVDFISYSPSSTQLVLTKNPIGFINVGSMQNYEGVSFNSSGQVDDESFGALVAKTLLNNGIKINKGGTRISRSTALPDDSNEFNTLFIDEKSGQMRDTLKFKKRILGLTSYFPDLTQLMPQYDGNMCILHIPMSDYQFGIYEIARQKERKVELNSMRNAAKNIFDDTSSTYKLFSRAFCNFVYPESITRPLPGISEEESLTAVLKEDDDLNDDSLPLIEEDGMEEELETSLLDGPSPTKSPKMNKIRKNMKEYHENLDLSLEKLIEMGPSIFSKEALKTYSPKFLYILENIMDPTQEGLHLLYSQFRKVEGIGIISLILNYNGFAEFKIKKSNSGIWTLDIPEADLKKPKYVLYTGKEETEQKEIIRKIFNSEWDQIPSELKDELASLPHCEYTYTTRNTQIECSPLPSSKLKPKIKITRKKKKLKTSNKSLKKELSQTKIQKNRISSLLLSMKGKRDLLKNASELEKIKLQKEIDAEEKEVNELESLLDPRLSLTPPVPGNESLSKDSESAADLEQQEEEEPNEKSDKDTLLTKNRFGNPTNNHLGQIIKLFMITSAAAEGITLKSVRYVHLCEPYWNPARLEQVIGRARRICSHKDLPESLRQIKVFLYVMIFSEYQLTDLATQELKLKDKGKIETQIPITTDQALLEISTLKHEISQELLRNMKEASIDCSLHNRSDSSEVLQCLSFGDVSAQEFSYVPNIYQDDSDEIASANQTSITWTPKEVTLGGTKFIMNETLFPGNDGSNGSPKTDPYYEIYDYDSYLKNIQSNGASALIKVGKILKPTEAGKKMIFRKGKF